MYWLADLCESEGIDLVLGHALYMKSIHGVKTKNDRIDSLKIARFTIKIPKLLLVSSLQSSKVF